MAREKDVFMHKSESEREKKIFEEKEEKEGGINERLVVAAFRLSDLTARIKRGLGRDKERDYDQTEAAVQLLVKRHTKHVIN